MESNFGLETFLALSRPELTCPTSVLVATAHWALCKRTALCVGTGESGDEGARSELLPVGWSSTKGVFCLRYLDSKGLKLLLKAANADVKNKVRYLLSGLVILFIQ